MLEKLLDGLRTLKQSRATTFTETARKLANGANLKTAEVDRVLVDCGKTPEQLQAAVELATKRIAWRQQVDDAKPLAKERERIAGKIADLQAAVDKAEEDFKAGARPLDGRTIEIQELEVSAHAAMRQLRDTCNDDVLAEVEAARMRLSEASSRADGLRKAVKLIETSETDKAEGDVYGLDSSKGRHWYKVAEQHERQSKAAQKELPGALREAVDAERTMREVEQMMLAP